MPPDSGGICMAVDERNHQFAPGLPLGWGYPARSGGGKADRESQKRDSRTAHHPGGVQGLGVRALPHLGRLISTFLTSILASSEVRFLIGRYMKG